MSIDRHISYDEYKEWAYELSATNAGLEKRFPPLRSAAEGLDIAYTVKRDIIEEVEAKSILFPQKSLEPIRNTILDSTTTDRWMGYTVTPFLILLNRWAITSWPPLAIEELVRHEFAHTIVLSSFPTAKPHGKVWEWYAKTLGAYPRGWASVQERIETSLKFHHLQFIESTS